MAFEATKLAHGEAEAVKARDAASYLLGWGERRHADALGHLPAPVLDLLVEAGLCKSKGDARRQIQQGAVRLGAGRDVKVEDVGLSVTEETVIWRGKKNCARIVPA